VYAVLDIETTGGSPKREKITEIAIYVYDGRKIIQEFQTLINPEKNIPYYITGLTGITNEMVADAPKFYEVAREIVKITEGKIVVGHNVNFDYGFMKEEFKRLGYQYERERLCTIKMSRKLIPGKRSYSLGKICSDLGILINERHRAAGDALATLKLLEYLLFVNGGNTERLQEIAGLSLKGLNPDFDRNVLKNIPEEAGVYYFHDDKGDILYIGKSTNLRNRVVSHLNNNNGKRAIEIKGKLKDITYVLTGSELVALLLESDEIKRFRPLYNRLQRRTASHHGLVNYFNEKGYKCLAIKKVNNVSGELITCFNNLKEARNVLNRLIEDYELCQGLCGIYTTNRACFHYEIGMCKGACIGKEPVDEYNYRVSLAVRSFQLEKKNFFIIDKGPSNEEKAIVKIENGKYIGFGFLGTEAMQNIELLHDCIRQRNDNRDVQQIIRMMLRKEKTIKILEYNA
jgi:DNA polymerase-3 subunit epsilon